MVNGLSVNSSQLQIWEAAEQGFLAFTDIFQRGLSVDTAQCNLLLYFRTCSNFDRNFGVLSGRQANAPDVVVCSDQPAPQRVSVAAKGASLNQTCEKGFLESAD